MNCFKVNYSVHCATVFMHNYLSLQRVCPFTSTVIFLHYTYVVKEQEGRKRGKVDTVMMTWYYVK